MKPLALAHAYMKIFFSGGDPDALRSLFAHDLVFEGPFYTFDSADSYLDSLRNDPPEGMHYDILAAFETASSACLVYRFSKPGVQTPMAQLFETEGNTIRKIVLIFDTGAFG